jgi:hypothetical protein
VNGFLQAAAGGLMLVLVALAQFAVAFGAHVLAWRLSDPKPSSVSLVSLFAAAVLAQSAALGAAALGGLVSLGPASIVVAGLTALAVSASYVMSFPAIQAHSPTVDIVQCLRRQGEAGLSADELYARLDERSLVSDRIDDVVHDGLATAVDGLLRPTARGRLLATIFTAWKALLGEAKGG